MKISGCVNLLKIFKSKSPPTILNVMGRSLLWILPFDDQITLPIDFPCVKLPEGILSDVIGTELVSLSPKVVGN